MLTSRFISPSSFLLARDALLRLAYGCYTDDSFFLPTLRKNTNRCMQRETVNSQGLGHCREETVPFEGGEPHTRACFPCRSLKLDTGFRGGQSETMLRPAALLWTGGHAAAYLITKHGLV